MTTNLLHTVLAAAIGSGCAVVADWMVRPEAHIDKGKVHLFVADWCPISASVLQGMQANPEFGDVIVAIPAGEADDDTTGPACAVAIADVRRNAPWLVLASDSWLCERLRIYGSQFYFQRLTALPGWAVGDVILTGSEPRDALLERGIRLCRRGLLKRQAEQCPPDDVSQAHLPPGGVAERGFDIGL